MYRNITVNLQNKHWINRLSRVDGANTTTTTTTTTVRNRSKQNGSQSWFNKHSQNRNNSPIATVFSEWHSLFWQPWRAATPTARKIEFWQHPPARAHSQANFCFSLFFFSGKRWRVFETRGFHSKRYNVPSTFRGGRRVTDQHTHTNRQNKAQNCASF